MTTTEWPHWLATEDRVRTFFEMMGFRVHKLSIAGRQIDIIATQEETFALEPETWVVEVTTEKVGAVKGGTDYQKLSLAGKEHNTSHLMLITTAGFTDDQAASLRRLGIRALTYQEFEASKINFRPYALALLESLKSPEKPDIGYDERFFITPALTLRERDGKDRPFAFDEWTKEILEGTAPRVGALLGGLGSGKTSVLQYVARMGCTNFIDSPSLHPIPLFLPLGRYKQHGGDIMQMLMSELTQHGLRSFPTVLLRQLITSRRVILLLDGLDEVHPIQNGQDVLDTVTKLLETIPPGAIGVISCRRLFFETSADEMAYFGSYSTDIVQAVQAKLAGIFAGHPTTYLMTVVPFDEGRIYRYLKLRCGMDQNKAKEFLGGFYEFSSLATTPVLLTMLATSIEEGLISPKDNNPFPEVTLYTAYIHRWFRRASDRARLTPEQRVDLSEQLAGHMLGNYIDSVSLQELQDFLRKQAAWENNPLPPDQVEMDVRASGFLIRDIDDRYRFNHRSIMEFLAATVEIRDLQGGGTVRPPKSDGVARFRTQIFASAWRQAGESPLHETSWDSRHGQESLDRNVELCAIASQLGPERKERPLGFHVGQPIRTTVRLSWKGVRFHELKWTSIGAAEFRDCHFENVTLSHVESSPLTVVDCNFTNSTIELPHLPTDWKLQESLEGPLAGLGVSEAVIAISSFVDMGARVRIAGQEWRIGFGVLDFFAVAEKKLRGVVTVDGFLRGAYSAALERLLPVLIREGWVVEDTSRHPHQLKRASKLSDCLKRLQAAPMEACAGLSIFDV